MENQTLSWIILLILGLSFMTCIADGLNVFCPSPVNGRFGESLTLSCDFPPDLFGVYWYEGHGTGEPVIRLQEGQRVGRGLDSGEYNITANGGLLIIDANFSHEQRFHVYVIDKTSKEGSFNITVKIIQGCRASHAVIGQTTTVSCSFKPGFYGIYWYDEDSVEDPFIRLQEGARYGRGFDSGEYNITNNGSLVINQITSAHNYSIYVPNEDGSDVTFYAQLIITGITLIKISEMSKFELFPGQMYYCFNVSMDERRRYLVVWRKGIQRPTADCIRHSWGLGSARNK